MAASLVRLVHVLPQADVPPVQPPLVAAAADDALLAPLPLVACDDTDVTPSPLDDVALELALPAGVGGLLEQLAVSTHRASAAKRTATLLTIPLRGVKPNASVWLVRRPYERADSTVAIRAQTGSGSWAAYSAGRTRCSRRNGSRAVGGGGRVARSRKERTRRLDSCTI